MCSAVFWRSQTAVAIGYLCCAESSTLHWLLADNSVIVKGSCHSSKPIPRRINAAFVTATALWHILSMKSKILSPGRFGSFIFFYLGLIKQQSHNVMEDREKSILQRVGKRERRTFDMTKSVASPPDGSAASQRSISQSSAIMVQETSCMKMTAADSEVETLMR